MQKQTKAVKGWGILHFGEINTVHLIKSDALAKMSFMVDMPNLKKLLGAKIIPVLITPIKRRLVIKKKRRIL